MNKIYFILLLFSVINGREIGSSDRVERSVGFFEKIRQILTQIYVLLEPFEQKCQTKYEKLEEIKEIKNKINFETENIINKYNLEKLNDDSQLFPEIIKIKNILNDQLILEAGNVIKQCLNTNEEIEQFQITTRFIAKIINLILRDGGKRLLRIMQDEGDCLHDENNVASLRSCLNDYVQNGITEKVNENSTEQEVTCRKMLGTEDCLLKSFENCSSQDLNNLIMEVIVETKSTLCYKKTDFFLIDEDVKNIFENLMNTCSNNSQKQSEIENLKKQFADDIKNISKKYELKKQNTDSEIFYEIRKIVETLVDRIRKSGEIAIECINNNNTNEEKEEIDMFVKVNTKIIDKVLFGDVGKLNRLYLLSENDCIIDKNNISLQLCGNYSNKILPEISITKKINRREEITCKMVQDEGNCKLQEYEKCNSQDFNNLMSEVMEVTNSTLVHYCTGCAVKINFYLITLVFLYSFFQPLKIL